jgi:hypothetical protein
MATYLMTPESQLRQKVEYGLAHCVDEHFYCKGCPYEELESGEFPIRCIYALLNDIQNLRTGNIPPMEFTVKVNN